jgi:hypothetical protein
MAALAPLHLFANAGVLFGHAIQLLIA